MGFISDVKEVFNRLFKINNEELCKAARIGDIQEVRRLIPISNPKANNSEALKEAAMCGHADCVELLIPVSDPKANNSEALRMAVWLEHFQCVKALMPVSDYEEIRIIGGSDQAIIEQAEADIQKEIIANAIGLDALTEQAPIKKRKI